MRLTQSKRIESAQKTIGMKFNPPFHAVQTNDGWRIYFNMGAPHIGEGNTEVEAFEDAADNIIASIYRTKQPKQQQKGRTDDKG